jgi:chemotaxis protein CheX
VDILSTLQKLVEEHKAHALPADLRRALVDPLGTAVCQATQEMTAVEFTLQSAHQLPAPAVLGDIAAVLELSEPLQGVLIMSFSTRTAEALAARVFAEVHEVVTPALVQDCMGEIGNVIAGQGKALLHGTPYHYSFSAPTIQAAADLKLPAILDSVVLAFDSDVGDCALQFCLKRAAAPSAPGT